MSEDFSLGFCQEHNRQYEVYCTVCSVLVCPSCIMFGAHIAHSVLPLSESVAFLRCELLKLSSDGKLKPEFAGRILQDIRDTRFKAESLLETVESDIENNFKQMISQLKTRREEVKDQVIDHYNSEIAKLVEEQGKWEKKEEAAVSLLQLACSDSDEELLKKCFEVLRASDDLNEAVEAKVSKLITGVQIGLHAESRLDYTAVLEALGGLGTFKENEEVQYRS